MIFFFNLQKYMMVNMAYEHDVHPIDQYNDLDYLSV